MTGSKLNDRGARLLPRSQHHTLEPAYRSAIEVWCVLAHRSEDDLDVYKTVDGVIVVDERDDAELHLVLDETPTNGQPVAIALFVEEMSW